jgi:hypothetical protein
MAMKKRVIAYGILILVVTCILAYRGLGIGRGVTYWNYLRIHVGMSQTEVVSLLDAQTVEVDRWGTPIRIPNQGCIEGWRGGGNGIDILYDNNGKVVEKEWHSGLGDLARHLWNEPVPTTRGIFFGFEKVRE